MNKILSAVIILAVILIVAALVVFLVAREKFEASAAGTACPGCPGCKTCPPCKTDCDKKCPTDWSQCPGKGYETDQQCKDSFDCDKNCEPRGCDFSLCGRKGYSLAEKTGGCLNHCVAHCSDYCPPVEPEPSTFCPANGYQKTAGPFEPFCHCDPGWEGDSCKTENSTYGCDAKGACNKTTGSQTLTDCQADCKADCADCPVCPSALAGGRLLDCDKECPVEWNDCTEHGYQTPTTCYGWLCPKCSDYCDPSSEGCDCYDWEQYCNLHDYYSVAQCKKKCLTDCGTNCPFPICPSEFCPSKGYGDKQPSPTFCPSEGPIINCDPNDPHYACTATAASVKINENFQDPANPDQKWVLIYGCGIAFQIQNSGSPADGWGEIADCIRDGIVDGKCQDPNCACVSTPTKCGCVRKSSPRDWDKDALARMLNNLRTMYSAYQQLYGIIEPGMLQIPGEDTMFILYFISYIAAGGESSPGESGASIGPDFFRMDYTANLNYPQSRPLEHVFWYESTRNFMFYSVKMEYSHTTPGNTGVSGFVGQGLVDIAGCLISKGLGLDFYYAADFGTPASVDRESFMDTNLAYFTFYSENTSGTLTFQNTFNVGEYIPFTQSGASIDGLYSGILVYLWRKYKGLPWFSRYIKSFLLLPDTNMDLQAAVDNYYLAASRATGSDMYAWFKTDADGLRWPISQKAQGRVQAFIARPDTVYHFANSGEKPYVCREGDLSRVFMGRPVLQIDNNPYKVVTGLDQFFETAQECCTAVKAAAKKKSGGAAALVSYGRP